MDSTLSRSNKAMHALLVFGLLMLTQRVGAIEYKVGGANGWSVITDSNTPSYNQWAEKNRFQIGDSLLFVYPANKDSVLQVNIDDYANCNASSPIAKFSDGNTSFKLTQSGPYYFISGSKDNCLKNERIHVIVLHDTKNQTSNTNQTAPATPPSPSSSGSLETPPSPPPSGSTEVVPAPAPVGEESPSPPAPPPSGASTVFVSVIGSLGTFVGSLILVL